MRIPLHFTHAEESAAVKLGGAIISHIANDIEVTCLPADLPEFIEVNLSNIEVGHSIHAKDVADALLFLLTNNTSSIADETGIKCPKFNIVGSEEIDNLSLASYIADVLGKKLNYEIIDFHSSRPGHDLRYALCGNKMKQMGWTPSEVYEKLKETVNWTVSNNRWLQI